MTAIDHEQAFALANDVVRKLAAAVENDFEILTGCTEVIDGGWVFFYNSVEFIRSGKFGSKLVGNGPILVLSDGTIHLLPSSPSWYEMAKEISNRKSSAG